MRPIPILFLSDSPDTTTGLGRITRDLATLLSRSPLYRVGVLGKGGIGSRSLPFSQYVIPLNGQWGEWELERAWNDFAGNEYGVIFTIWDASRLLWFARPQYSGSAELQAFLSSKRFQRWGYMPIDSTGPGDRLTSMAAECLFGFDRLLAYTRFGRGVIERSIGSDASRAKGLDWIPHGLNLDQFQPRLQSEAHRVMGTLPGDFVLGVVATNQPRKDWGLVMAVAAEMKRRKKRFRLWAHVDMLERHWDIRALLMDYGLLDSVIVTHKLSDHEMSYRYSACSVTLHPGLGEGFCYPIAESLACGTPAIHGDYAGGGEITPEGMRVTPVTFRLDTLFDCLRPVFAPEQWVDVIERVVEANADADSCRAQVAHLDWKSLWPSCWERWFSEGTAIV